MNLLELAQYANLLLVPAVVYIIGLEKRLIRLEVALQELISSLSKHVDREERLMCQILEKKP